MFKNDWEINTEISKWLEFIIQVDFLFFFPTKEQNKLIWIDSFAVLVFLMEHKLRWKLDTSISSISHFGWEFLRDVIWF